MAKIVVCGDIPESGAQVLREAGHEVLLGDFDMARQEAADIAGLLSMLSDPIDADFIAAAPALRVIANYAVGYNNIDLAAASKAGIVVCNTPDVLTEATADCAWALLLAAARRVPEGDRMVRAGQFVGWQPRLLLGHELFGKTIGIVGAGRIGQAVARRALGFGLKVIYFNRSRLPLDIESVLQMEHVRFADLLERSDFISINCPLNDASRHMFGTEQFRAMKSTAVLVNTGRGACLVEAELVQALRQGEIAAAGLDVFEHEPALAPGLCELDNVVLLPHVGSATHDTRGVMAELAARNIVAVLAGRAAETAVNPEVQGR